MLTADVLVGAWRLEAFDDIDASGRVISGPLGPEPAGFLLYLPNRYMSVGMMRTSPGTPQFLGYAGRWSVRGDYLVHHIVASSRSDWVGTEQIRSVELDGDRLSVNAVDPGLGRLARHAVSWRRVPADD